MRNWGQPLLMLGLASLIAIEVVGLTGEPKIDSVPVTSFDFSAQSLNFKPMSGPPQLTTRPLFRQTRRPPEVPVQNELLPIEQTPTVPSIAQTPPEQVPTFQHQLTAVVITGNEATAYLVDPENLDLIRLRKGDQIDGWVLHEVFPDAVVLGYGAQKRTRLELWTDERRAEFSVHLNEDQDVQGDFEHSQGEFSAPEFLPVEPPPRRPARGPRSRVH